MRDDGVVDRPSAERVPRRERERLADVLQRTLGVLAASDDPGDRALRRDLQRFAEALRGLRDDSR